MSRSKCRIYVGNLPPDIRSKDIEDLFYRFGKIAFVDLKTRRGPPFAFVEFVDPRDAKDAVYERDGYDYDGYKLRVEFPRGRERGPGGVFKSGCSSSRPPPARRSSNRILVTGLPSSGSWQDLKDHMREAGDVCYADVFKDGTGVVEFLRRDDMKYAIDKLNGSKFRSHEGETSYIKIKEDNARRNSRAYSRSRSSSRSYSRSKSRSYSRSRSRSRDSPTYSPSRHSRSRSRSRETPAYSPLRRSRSRSRSSSASASSRTPSKRSESPEISRYKASNGHNNNKRLRSYSRSPSYSRSRSRSHSGTPNRNNNHLKDRSMSRSRSPADSDEDYMNTQ